MALREYECPTDGRFEVIVVGLTQEFQTCPKCGDPAMLVEWSVPARRNPSHGIQT